MKDLNHAEPSPRICEDGCIHWYVGDTACIELNIDLYSICEETAVELPITIKPTDKVRVCFKNFLDKKIYEFEFTNVKNNTVELCITKEITKLFKRGTYTYCVHIETYADSEIVKTIAYKNKVEVE